MTREALLPCPFCGHQPRSRWFGAHGEDDDSGYWGIDCCQAFAHEDSEAEAIAAWNTRTRPQDGALVAKWLPIESAPRDGTRIILAWGGKSHVGYWLDNTATRWPWAGWKVPSMEPQPTGAAHPTHWQPLPAPPADELEAALAAKETPE